MLLGCSDLRLFGLVHQHFPKPYVEVQTGLRLAAVTSRRVGRGHDVGSGLRKMEDD